MAYTKPRHYNVTIENIDEIILATVDHQGDYMKINHAFSELFDSGHKMNLLRDTTRMIALYYDDPTQVPVEKLRSKAGFTLDKQDFKQTGTVKKTIISSGKYAMVIHKGPYEALKDPYSWLWDQWFPNSGEMFKINTPCLEEYLNSPRDIAPEDLLTKIYVPLC